MKKSALISGIVAFLFATGSSTIISPICVPCLMLVVGLMAGYLAGVFDKPTENNHATKSGALAGLIGGVGALLGQVTGALINGLLVGPAKTVEVLYQMGIPAGSPAMLSEIYWPVLIGSALCLGIFNLALMSGLGAAGGILWWQTSGKKNKQPITQDML